MSAQSQIFNPTLRTSQASGDGFSCPVMNTASRATLNFGVSDKGMMVYDTTLANVLYWNGTVWVPLGGGGLVPVGASLNTEVIYNNAGMLEGDTGLTFNNVTNALTIAGPLAVGGTLTVTGAFSPATLSVSGATTLTGAATLLSTLAVTGATTLTAAATVQGCTLGRGASAIATNTAFGVSALGAVTIATESTAIGKQSLLNLTSGIRNTAVGSEALRDLQIGIGSTAVGLAALQTSTGSSNTAIGDLSLQQLVAGDSNTACGQAAGSVQTGGNNNAFFGFGSYADLFNGSNQYNYGNVAVLTHKFRAGDVVLGTGNVVMSTAGKGIDFSATAGVGTSELLADYEEGTWIPTDASGAGLFITYGGCVYTKIGRIVTIQGLITYPLNISGLDAIITGLPFLNVSNLGLNSQYGSETTLRYLYGATTQNISLYNVSLTPITNTAMANDSFFLSGTYTAAT